MKKIIITILAIAAILALTLLLARNFTGEAVSQENNADVEIKVNALRFGYSPDIINVKQGEVVKISINNTDTPHGIRIPDLEISGENSIEFIAETPGEYTWYCYIPCGDGHKEMQGKIIIE